MPQEAFTLSWDDEGNHCNASRIVPGLLADLDLRGDSHDDELISELEFELEECPTDHLDRAVDHLQQAARGSDAAHDLLRETLSELDRHGRYCQCVTDAWDEFAERLDRHLTSLGEGPWLIDDLKDGQLLSDIDSELTVSALLGGDLRTADRPDVLELRWTGHVLIASGRYPSGRWFEIHHELLESPFAVVAYMIADDSNVPNTTTPAHIATGHDADVVEAAWGAADGVRSYGVTATVERHGWSSTVELLDQLARMKTRLDGPHWQAICRLIDGCWTGSLTDLEGMAAAVLTPAG
jgi:hypothetical protein